MIHKFSIDNENIVVDVNGGSVLKVDNLVYDILDYYKEKNTDEVVHLLSDRYSSEEINEGIREIDQLESKGLIFTSDEYSDLPVLKSESVVKALCLHVSHDCNLRCRYCFASYGYFGGNRGVMSPDIGKRAIDFLINNSGDRHNLEVDFFGGEPLLNFDCIKEVVQYANHKAPEFNKVFKFTLTTNATLLNNDVKGFINKHISNIVLSIDGRKSVNDNMRNNINGLGTYDNILPSIIELAESRNQENYYVRGTYSRYNLDFSKDVLHLADLGFKQISIEPVVGDIHEDYSIQEEDLPTLYKEYEILAKEYIKRRKEGRGFNFFHFMVDLNQGPCISKRLSGCGAGHEYLAVTPEGDVYPCHQFVGNQSYKVGSVLCQDLNRNIQLKFKDTNVYSKDACKKCWAKFYCSGGCHASAYKFSNSIEIPYKIGCELEKKRVECALYIAVKENGVMKDE